MKILWTREALDQLIGIEDFIAQDSPERAARFVNEMLEQVESTLPENPQIGRIVPEISNPNIREMIYHHYRIVYRVNEDTLEILTVFEAHRLWRNDERW